MQSGESADAEYPLRIFYRQFQRRRGRWLSLRYDQSFTSQATRPLLRLSKAGGEIVEHILPAATFGSADWIGFSGAEFTAFEILIYRGRVEDFRVDRVEEFNLLGLQRRLWRRGPRQFRRFWTRDWWLSFGKQYGGIPFLPDRYRLDEIAVLAAKRGRPIERDGFDRAPPPGHGVEFLLVATGDAGALAATVASLRDQAGGGWMLTVAVSTATAAVEASPNVRVVAVPAETSPDEALAGLIANAAGSTIGFLDPGDRLAPEAMTAIHAMLAAPAPAAMVYTDSALIDSEGRLTSPRLKPDWSPEFFRHRDYIGGLWLLDTALAKAVAPTLRREHGPLRHQLPPAMAERTNPDRIRHIKRVILLQPERPTPDIPAPAPAVFLEPEPTVSIVIPTRDRHALLQRAIESVRGKTRYANYEIVVVDNASAERPALDYLEQLRAQGIARIIEDRGDFNFPRLINRAVTHATGQVVVLLNNDTFVIEPNWLAELVRLAVQPRIGAVGAKLLYPDGTIQHAGVVVGLLGYAGHYFRRLPSSHRDSLGRLTAVHEVSAVTAACLAITRANYDAAGGFDESLAIDFNDVDFCLRLGKLGLRTLWTPHAILGHAESASRTGPKGRKSPRFQAEARRFAGRWRAETLNDPYFHPALALRMFDEMVE